MNAYVRIIGQIVFYLTCLCALLLPFNFLVPQTATFLVFFWLIGMNWKEKWNNIRNAPMIWLWVVFAILYIAGYFWSENKQEAQTSLLVKLGIFVFPIIFASTRYDERKSRLIMQSFLSGLILVGMFLIARAAYYDWEHNVKMWSYQDFAQHIMHPSYLSMFYVTGIMISFHGILLRDVPKSKKLIAVLFVLFFCIMIFMLASKSGIISLAGVFLFYIGYAVVRFKRYAVAGISIVTLIAAFVIAVKSFPALESRLNAMSEALTSNTPIDPADAESNRVRILIWQVDREIISKHPWTGMGTGGVQDALMQKYAEKGMTGAIDKKLNAHSQFYQTGIALGLPGMIILIGIFLAGFVSSVRNRFGFGALLTLLLVFNFLPESILQLQAGTLFVGFFYSLVLFSVDRKLLSPDI